MESDRTQDFFCLHTECTLATYGDKDRIYKQAKMFEKLGDRNRHHLSLNCHPCTAQNCKICESLANRGCKRKGKRAGDFICRHLCCCARFTEAGSQRKHEKIINHDHCFPNHCQICKQNQEKQQQELVEEASTLLLAVKTKGLKQNEDNK